MSLPSCPVSDAQRTPARLNDNTDRGNTRRCCISRATLTLTDRLGVGAQGGRRRGPETALKLGGESTEHLAKCGLGELGFGRVRTMSQSLPGPTYPSCGWAGSAPLSIQILLFRRRRVTAPKCRGQIPRSAGGEEGPLGSTPFAKRRWPRSELWGNREKGEEEGEDTRNGPMPCTNIRPNLVGVGKLGPKSDQV